MPDPATEGGENVTVELETRKALVKKYQRNGADTGSPEVQIALLTERIKSLTTHLIANKKDVSSRRGLQLMVGQRRRLLTHLTRIEMSRYREVIASLGLRR